MPLCSWNRFLFYHQCIHVSLFQLKWQQIFKMCVSLPVSLFFFLHLSFVFFCLHAALPWPKLWVFLQPVHHLAACHSLAQWAYKRLSPPANVNTTTSPPATVVPILCHLTSFVSVIAWCWFTTKLTFFVLLCNIDFMSSN